MYRIFNGNQLFGYRRLEPETATSTVGVNWKEDRREIFGPLTKPLRAPRLTGDDEVAAPHPQYFPKNPEHSPKISPKFL
jgi:hypothetical protein